MVKNHMKRINAPQGWDILRKKHIFITRPNPGRDMSLCISLNTVLKELLNKTKTTKESKYLIRNIGVLVNGKRRYDEKFPVGFLDVVSFPTLKENYRMLVDESNKIFMLKISEEEAKLKLSKVLDKKHLPKNKTQINFTDGRNFLISKDSVALKDAATDDCVLHTLPEQKVKQVLKLEKESLVYLYKGKHTGLVVNVHDFKEENIVFKVGKDLFETKKAYAFVVGKTIPVIALAKK